MKRAFSNGFSRDKIKLPLQEKHKAAMLDLILAWASLDGALGMLLTRFLGMPMHLGPEEIGKINGSQKMAKMIKILMNSNHGSDAASILKKYKRKYERYSKIRNRVAHSHCAGFSFDDDDYVIFATFERCGEKDLLVEAIPIGKMKEAKTWGEALLRVLLALVDRTNDA